ncbi:uncharacterized protein J3R85_018099 [Psidium guajava]|nr:uncharacterized protein J3R85_018099 [Psidium guajava]
MCNGSRHNVGVMLELVAAHLMLLDSNEEAIENIFVQSRWAPLEGKQNC